ncbi:MAG: hypothetical protein ACTSU4_06330 [Promethearchaeota archaeon]
MSDSYDYFMVFGISETGERVRLAVSEEELENILHPEEVFIIVKEELRRIYIWKGAKSPVRKRFISSRIASALQEELVKEAAFHRCKIVSVDQGDEVEEFLRAFGLKSMEVTERLADMRYVRNIEKERGEALGKVVESKEIGGKAESEPYFSPALQEIEKKTGQKIDVSALQDISISKKNITPMERKKPSPARTTPPPTRTYIPYPTGKESKNFGGLFEEDKKRLLDRILKSEIPQNHKRQNLILGNQLYAPVFKKVNVFGKDVEETEWEPLKTLPKNMVELDDHLFRVYFNDDKGIVEAVEIITREKVSDKDTTSSDNGDSKNDNKNSLDLSPMTVKELKLFAKERKIELPTKAKKGEIIEIIENVLKNEKEKERVGTPKKRKLPEIPKA